jgi:hypothetical protein
MVNGSAHSEEDQKDRRRRGLRFNSGIGPPDPEVEFDGRHELTVVTGHRELRHALAIPLGLGIATDARSW